MSNPKYISFNGEVVPFDQARVHVRTPAFRYAANVFEGLRGYWNADRQELYLFRLAEHFRRLDLSMKVMSFAERYEPAYLSSCLIDLIRANDLREDIHIVLMAYIDGDGEMFATGPLGMTIAALPKGRTPKADVGLDCAVSSWARMSDHATPPRIKTIANYYNGRLGWMQARQDGYDLPIFLTSDGKVAEAPNACLFMVRDGVPATPSVTHGILESITRATVIELMRREPGVHVVEREIDRTELYAAEEVFLCGSGVEIVPVVSVDRRPVGDGRPGPLTRALTETYMGVVRGEQDTYADWLTPVYGNG